MSESTQHYVAQPGDDLTMEEYGAKIGLRTAALVTVAHIAIVGAVFSPKIADWACNNQPDLAERTAYVNPAYRAPVSNRGR